MITAAAARAAVESEREDVFTSEPFLNIIHSLEREINNAIKSNLTRIEVIDHCLHVLAGYKMPRGYENVRDDAFWLPYVMEYTKKLDYKWSRAYCTMGHYWLQW